jgi:ppGpp synthetase/RelA/SpoT-type nucleotidyltranferase
VLLVFSFSIFSKLQEAIVRIFSGVRPLLTKYREALVMNVDEVIKKYVSEQRDTYKLLSEKTKEFLLSILHSKSIVPHSITSREKDPEELREKINREGESPDALFNDITDLAGVRIIAYFPSDVDKIITLIEKEFNIDSKHSIDKRLSSDPAIFGYASVHFVVKFRPEALKLPKYSIFDKMKCEIQVRTILQHAWAEIEHDIVYKSPGEIPFRVRRRFACLAGLLEIADREFESLRQDEKAVRQAVQRRIKHGKIDT